MPYLSTLVFDLSLWKALLGILLIALAVFLYRRTFPPIVPWRRFTLACLRVLGFVLLLLFVLNPISVSVRSDVRSPLVVALLDVSKSMSVRDHDGGSRWEKAVESVRRFSAALRERGEAEIEIVPFAGDCASGPAPPDSIPAPDEDGTDILQALETAQVRFRSRNLAAIVLFTDGRITRGMTSFPINITVPVFTVGFGDTLGGTDAAIDRIRYDRVAYVGTEAQITGIVTATGLAGATVLVRLEEDGAVLDSKELHVRDVSTELAARLTFVPGEEGDRNLTVRLIPPREDGREENNAESIRIRVLGQELKIAYIDRFADWNTTFIMEIGRNSPRFDIETITWLPEKGFISLPDRSAWRFPKRSVDFERYDLIIVADETSEFARGGRVEALDEYIAGGGGFLLLADENTPLASLEAARLLGAVLPVTPRGSVMVKAGEFHAVPSRVHPEHPLAAIFAEYGKDDGLPPLTARLTNLDVTAGAEVPLLMSDGTETVPLCAIQRRGRGVTAAVLGFPLWRWRLAGREGRALYEALVGGLIQYLAEDIDAPACDLMTDRTTYRAGDEIGLTVFTRQNGFVDGVRGEVIRIGNGEETILRTFLFEPEPRGEGCYRALLEPLRPGEYRIVASEVRDGGSGFSGETTIVVHPVSVEFLKTSRDNDLLRSVADVSGGGLITSAAIHSLPRRLSLSPDTVERKKVRPFRQSIVLFVLIVLVFAAEWTLRKAWGLV